MKPRSLLAAAVLGLFMLQPVSNLAEAAATKSSQTGAKPVPKKPVAKAAANKKKAAVKPSTRKATQKASAKHANNSNQ